MRILIDSKGLRHVLLVRGESYAPRCESYVRVTITGAAAQARSRCCPCVARLRHAARGSERAGAHRLEAVLEAKTWLRLYIQPHGMFIK